MIYYSEEGFNLCLAIVRIVSFYRDVVFDALLICILYNLDDNILSRLVNENEESYYDSVAGINLRLTCYYLLFVLIASEAWIYIV